MTPTNKLRFVERIKQTGEHFEQPPKIRILQQWWATDPDCYEDWVMKVNGEWRDVPIEEQA